MAAQLGVRGIKYSQFCNPEMACSHNFTTSALAATETGILKT